MQFIEKRKFRGDIQFLRAFAVISILIFHIDPKYLPGGFIGVDIFFVISGFLISGQILTKLQNNSFSLLKFYSDRMLRLFPALIVMLTSVSTILYFLYLPIEYESYANSVISTLLYVSNFWFYSEFNYFNDIAETAVLLHTWSLSVEEQFYMFLPLMLLFANRISLSTKLILSITFLSTLLISEFLVYTDPSLSFYASFSRFWQFTAGSLLFEYRKTISKYLKNFWISEISAVTSLIYLCLAVLFTSEDEFPGFNALAVTIATAVFIASEPNRNSIIKNWVSNQLSVYVGNISYSLYLWHWPIIVVFKHQLAQHFYGMEKLKALAVCLVMGSLSYHVIEQKTRYKKLPLNPITCASCIIVLFCAILITTKTTINSRFSESALDFQQFLNYENLDSLTDRCFLTPNSNSIEYFDKQFCTEPSLSKRNILLIGDSHANHWFSAIEESKPQNTRIAMISSYGCEPTLKPNGQGPCKELMNWAFDTAIPQNNYDLILLSARWRYSVKSQLFSTIDYLNSLGQSVVLLGPSLEYHKSLPRLLAESPTTTVSINDSNYGEVVELDRAMQKWAEEKQVFYISALTESCITKQNCKTHINNVPVLFDYGHLTHQGAEYLLNQINFWEQIETAAVQNSGSN